VFYTLSNFFILTYSLLFIKHVAVNFEKPEIFAPSCVRGCCKTTVPKPVKASKRIRKEKRKRAEKKPAFVLKYKYLVN
jgi:hypothetical protein